MFVVVLALTVVTAFQSRTTSPLDRPIGEFRIPSTFKPCDVHGVVEKIGRVAGVPVGFEAGPDCADQSASEVMGGPMPGARVETGGDTVDLTGETLRAALDAMTARARDYMWKEIDGVIVVRPKEAWDNVWDPLTVPFRSDTEGRRLDAAFNSVLEKRKHAPLATTGTLLQRLNTAVRAEGAGQWGVAVLYGIEWTRDAGPGIVIVIRAGGRRAGPATSFATSVPLISSQEQP